EGCLECGTCRIACEFIEWRNPKGGYGVCYRYG
ncbi:MAG: ferredoxin family protein, partial [Nitrospinota bacterium]